MKRKKETTSNRLLAATAPATGLCPRCLLNKLNKKQVFNSLSRYAEIFICTGCGAEEDLFGMGIAKSNETRIRHERMLALARSEKRKKE